MRTDRYDIEAKADRELALPVRESAVMALLAERFKLESHQETREVPGLVVKAPRTPAGVKPATPDQHYSIRMDDQGDVVFTTVAMPGFTNYLSQMWRAPVTDETELKGAWNFVLATSRVEPQPGANWGDRVREAIETLGLTVENRRTPLQVTVVDRCERPDPN